jgi:signal transduction histidine kinase
MIAVFVACVVFGAVRLAVHLATGLATPWWVNAGGAVAIAVLWAWYRGDPDGRSPAAVHGTAFVATVTLLVPAAYGMTSSKWWLALIGFAVLLMGRRREAVLWTVATIVLMPAVALVEPAIQVATSAGESAVERAMAALFFGCVLLGITWAFRGVAGRRARELTETAASLARANHVKSRFLAHVSHEVRTPLHGVIAMTDLALEGQASPSVHEQVQSAQESARALLGLLNNMLDVTRAESDALQLDPRPFDLHGALVEALRPMAAQARARGLAIEARAERGLPERRVGDRIRVAQIVMNLVGNALKFTKHGTITVRLLGVVDDPDRVVLDVTDTGVGIAADKVDSVFEPFVQASPSDANIQGGAGLGLSIVRELARLMGGSVTVRSEVGRGSTFTVTMRLPRDPHGDEAGEEDLLPAARTSMPRSAPPAAMRARVLVCEDNPMNRKVLVAMLGKLGHEPVMVEDGLAAWELLAKETFDVVVTDVEMPGLDGIELTRRLRAREAENGATAPRVPVIGATAHVGEDERERLLAAGMDAHLGKPFTLADLSTVLAKALNRRA